MEKLNLQPFLDELSNWYRTIKKRPLQHQRAQWFNFQGIKVFIRPRQYYLNRWGICLAAIEIPESLQNQGIAKTIIYHLRTLSPNQRLLIECVNSDILSRALLRWGAKEEPHRNYIL